MRPPLMLLAMAVLSFASIGFAADDADKVLKEIEGKYELKSLTMNGMPAPEEMTKDLKGIEIKDGQIIIKFGDREDAAKMKLDPSKKPAQVDLAPVKDPADKPRLGIYKFEKDELTISFSRGGDRPKEFDGKGAEVLMMVIKKKDAK